MESSAVVYCNSVLGARTNTEGRESTSAAMLTGKIPDWGLHRDEFRHRLAPHRGRDPGRSVMDWGMLGYFVGDVGAGAHSGADRQLRHSPISSATNTSARPRPPPAAWSCITSSG